MSAVPQPLFDSQVAAMVAESVAMTISFAPGW